MKILNVGQILFFILSLCLCQVLFFQTENLFKSTFIFTAFVALTTFLLAKFEARSLKAFTFPLWCLAHLLVFLFGMSLLFGSVSLLTEGQLSFNFEELTMITAELISRDRIFLLGYIFIIASCLSLIGAFPSQVFVFKYLQKLSWWGVFFWFLLFQLGVFLILSRTAAWGSLQASYGLRMSLQWIAVLSFLSSHILALRQTDLKSLIIASSMAYNGYFLGLILVFGSSSTELDLSSTLIKLIIMGSAQAVLIGLAGFITYLSRKSLSVDFNDNTEVRFKTLIGMALKAPKSAWSLSFVLFCLSGVPPLLGFFIHLDLSFHFAQARVYWLLMWFMVGWSLAGYYYICPILEIWRLNLSPSKD